MNLAANYIEDEDIQRQDIIKFSLKGKTPEQRIKLLILRDLNNIGWDIKFDRKKIEIIPPETYNKDIIRQAMSIKRQEIINNKRVWIDKHLNTARVNLADGSQVLFSNIEPSIETCETQKQKDLFRIFRYYWSSPYSDYVGRRLKFLIRDTALPNKPIIGIAALGSPIIHIPERDIFIGWDKQIRTKNLIYTMDAYVIGALPPYNYLLGGKLISLLLASKEIRKIYEEKYRDKITIIDKRSANTLVGIFTTSLYGRSSQYNRLVYRNNILYQPIGQTKGYGTLHLSKETIQEMVRFLKYNNIYVNHRFGDGPSWVMRVISTAGELVGFNSNFLLQHSFKRGILFLPLAINYNDFLNDKQVEPIYYDYTKEELIHYWKERWFENRKKNEKVIKDVLSFKPENFVI
jgi:hypothetical protein